MRKFKNIIRQIIEESGLRLNTISKTSGISHTYLTKLINNNINRPGKDKIASIMLALNFSVDQIDQVLAEYDYQALDEPDIPDILKNNRKRKIMGNTLSLYDDIHVKLLLSPMERMGGTKILVKKAPSVMFMPDALYLGHRDFSAEQPPPVRNFYDAFTRALFRERKAIFRQSCEDGALFETFICRHCLDDYFKNAMADDSINGRELVIQFFANAAAAIRSNPKQHRTWIMQRCPWFDYMIQGNDRPAPKVFFFGKKSHEYGASHGQINLQGFTSDSPSMIDLFRKETTLCRRAVDGALKDGYPDSIISYFSSLFAPYGIQDQFQIKMDQADRETRSR